VSEKSTECDGDQARAQVFEQHRRRLLGVSYRILGSVADAEGTFCRTLGSGSRLRTLPK
jgi:hypothetical protein